jgi:hypothetical protein
MTAEQAIAILRHHNAWRRGEEIPMGDPAEIGRAIDVLVDLAERLLKTAEGESTCQ